MADDEEITPYDGPTDLDEEGNRQPVAGGADEDQDPEAQAGEVLPDDEQARP